MPFSTTNLFGMTIRESATDGSDFTNPDADYRRLFLGEDGLLHVKDSAGAVTNPYSSGGTTITGMIPIATPPGWTLSSGDTIATAGLGIALPMLIPGAMKIRAAVIRVTSTGAGSHEWGLFDYSSNAAAATKLAGGAAALGATGWVDIAATGAPVTIAAGNYMFVFKFPAATQATIGSNASSVVNKTVKSISSYAWDDTPDFTASWADYTEMPTFYIRGDLNASSVW